MVSFRTASEIWVIDHSISTREAAGPAGDAAFRWGNPSVYDHGDTTDQQLFGQHNAEWIPKGRPGAGNILVFSNGAADTRPYSSVDEITPVTARGRYRTDAEGRFLPATRGRSTRSRSHSDGCRPRYSGAQRQVNGNTLIADGPAGRVFEVTAGGDVVWEYVNPFYDATDEPGTSARGDAVIPWRIFRAERYPPNYPGLARLSR